jgi:arabinofuranosyltransferase
MNAGMSSEPRHRIGILLGTLTLGLFVAVLLSTAWVADDAYITFRTVDNLAQGYGLRWNVAERVQSFTHPLWMIFFALSYLITHEAFLTAITLGAALSTLTALLVLRSSGTLAAGIAGVALLISSKAFVDYSTSGLENPLTHLLLVLFLLVLWRPDGGRHRPLLLSLTACALLLNRLDLSLLVMPAALAGLGSAGRGRAIRPAAAGFLPLAVWSAFSLFYYGSVLPNTALAKLGAGIARLDLLRQGSDYFVNSLRLDPVTLVVIAAGLIAGFLDRRWRGMAPAAGVALYLLYALWIGGDFMTGRFLTAPFLVGVLLLIRHPWAARPTGAAAVAGAGLILGLVSPGGPLREATGMSGADPPVMDRSGIADERRYYAADSGLWSGKGKLEPRGHWVEQARAARERGDPLAVAGAIGFFGFTAGPDVHVVDVLGLADPLLSRLPAVTEDPDYMKFYERIWGKPPVPGWRIGHFRRNVPEGYLAHLLGDSGRFVDPEVESLVARLTLVTRGDLLDPRRLRQIVRFNLGLDGGRLDAARYRITKEIPWEEAVAVRPDFLRARLEVAERLIARGDLDGALALSQGTQSLEPDDPSILATIGWIHLQKNDAPGSLVWLERAVRIDPSLVEAHLNLATAYNAMGRHEDALRLSRRAIELAPDAPAAHFNLGVALAHLGRDDDAVQALGKAVALRSDHAGAWLALGHALARLGRGTAARDAWRQAAEHGSREARELLDRPDATR